MNDIDNLQFDHLSINFSIHVQVLYALTSHRSCCREDIAIQYIVHTTRFWNNLQQIRSMSKGWKTNTLKVVGSKKGSKQDSQDLLIFW